MITALVLTLVALADEHHVSTALLRRAAGEIALQQAKRMSPEWEPRQRDCAGFVRFVWRESLRKLDANRLARPLFVDDRGAPTDFADARTLVVSNMRTLGRGDEARAQLQTGDVLAFRQERAEGEVWHLMMVVVPPNGAKSLARVVYHTGEADQGVRIGTLDSLTREAPLEWQPAEHNHAFLGFYRLKEWF